MSYYSIEIPKNARPKTSVTVATGGMNAISAAVDPLSAENDERSRENAPSFGQVMEMIDRSIANLKVYVVESEITQTQNAIKTVVEQASF